MYGRGNQGSGYGGGPPQGPPPGNWGYGGGNQNQGYANEQYSRPSQPPPGQWGYGGNDNRDQYSRPSQPPPNQNQNQYQNQNQNQNQGGYSNQPQHGGGNYSRPSSQQQNFGGNLAQTYQYSNCNGTKKALLIGINYIGTKNQLRGCINDAENMRNFLLNWGFKQEDIVMLRDDASNRRQIPTRQNIIDAMGWLVKGAKPNDNLVLHYSGHGGQTKDLDGDEDDGYDEVLYPLDFETSGFIVDDEIHDRVVKPLPQGCRLTALIDACHSASMLDLPYIYSTKGVVKEPNLYADAGQDVLTVVQGYMSGNQKNMFAGVKSLVKTIANKDKASKAREFSKQNKTSPADVISISGCKDDQTSADAKEAGQNTGAMSYAFIRVMSTQPQQSYITLLQSMRDVLQGKYTQKPQLSSSHPIDTNLQFII